MRKIVKKDMSLAQFAITRREELGLSQEQLAEKSSLKLAQLLSIEQGFDLFLSTTIRQKLAKGLKIENKEIKLYEASADFNLAKKSKMEEIRELILMNSSNPNYEIFCPNCGSKLITRIAKLYDLEDNLILHPKARCTKCPFQLTDC